MVTDILVVVLLMFLVLNVNITLTTASSLIFKCLVCWIRNNVCARICVCLKHIAILLLLYPVLINKLEQMQNECLHLKRCCLFNKMNEANQQICPLVVNICYFVCLSPSEIFMNTQLCFLVNIVNN